MPIFKNPKSPRLNARKRDEGRWLSRFRVEPSESSSVLEVSKNSDFRVIIPLLRTVKTLDFGGCMREYRLMFVIAVLVVAAGCASNPTSPTTPNTQPNVVSVSNDVVAPVVKTSPPATVAPPASTTPTPTPPAATPVAPPSAETPTQPCPSIGCLPPGNPLPCLNANCEPPAEPLPCPGGVCLASSGLI